MAGQLFLPYAVGVTGQTPLRAGPLSHAIFRVARVHKALAARLLRETGLHPGQELVLMTLWQQGPQRQVDLVQSLDSDAPTMARSLSRLEKSGLIRRRPSDVDRRAVIVEATEASRELRHRVESAWSELERLTTATLPPARRSELLALLNDLEKGLAAASEPHAAEES